MSRENLTALLLLSGMNIDVDTVQLKTDLTEATGCDIRLCWSTKHFGKKNKNPLDFMRYGVVIHFHP